MKSANFAAVSEAVFSAASIPLRLVYAIIIALPFLLVSGAAQAELSWFDYVSGIFDQKKRVEPAIGHISKDVRHGALVLLGDPLDQSVLPKKAVLPPGTNVFLFDRYQNRNRKKRKLALTSLGLFAYVPTDIIKPGWYYESFEQDNGPVADGDDRRIRLIRRVEIEISDRLSAILESGLVMSEIEDRTGFENQPDDWIIELNSTLVEELRADFKKIVAIPSASAQLFASDSETTMYDHFTRAFADGVYGVSKPCSSKTVRKIDQIVRGEIGIGKDVLFAKLNAGIELSAEESLVENFDETTSIYRVFYRRLETAGTYRFTERTESCNKADERLIKYSIVLPGGQEIIVDENFLGGALARPNENKAPIVATCTREYQMVIDGLVEAGVTEIDAPFFASLVTTWKVSNIGECQ